MPEQREEAGQPCLLVAHSDEHRAALISRAFRRLGYDTYSARNGPEARRLARLLDAEVMVMAADLEEESGWLTCEKVRHDLPYVKVFLIGKCDRENEAFARFVGAACLIDTDDSLATLVDVVCNHQRAAAG